MASFELRALTIAVTLAASACDARTDNAGAPVAKGSLTIKLPPPRPAVPAPAFSFKVGEPSREGR